MFTTFAAPTGESSSSTKLAVRPKRNQVARACNWCRVHRVRCDNSYPCHNCQRRGGHCTKKGGNEIQSLPQALREVEQLRGRVKELEEQLQNTSITAQDAAKPASAEVETTQPSDIDLLADHGGKKKHWEGIHTSTAQSRRTQSYGPASSFYFIGRMSSYLNSALDQPYSDRHILPNTASKYFASPISPKGNDSDPNLITADVPITGEGLTAAQEGYFISLFWHSFHSLLQAVDEVEFWAHYKSLWTEDGTYRRPSALVDIVVALCMQCGIAFKPRNETSTGLKIDVDNNDATIAGRWLYRRAQTLITDELESPSMTTLQCLLLSVSYLCCASFHNMSHSTLALAIRTAQTLGIHLEPPKDIPQAQRELRKRLWWALYVVESKTCMKLGRPWSVQLSEVTCSLPADDRENALLLKTDFISVGKNVTWLSYSLHNARLILAARAVHVPFYDKCADILSTNGGKSFYTDNQSLEKCAEFLLSRMEYLHSWLRDVPEALKTKRTCGSKPFSAGKLALDIEPFAPVWLQRQRLYLEILYHILSMNLYRPFISFSPSSNTPLAEQNAKSSVNHAMAITYIIYQSLSETDTLSGWPEVYQWQWNATLTLIGYTLAYPLCPITYSVREAINSAIVSLQVFGRSMAVAASAVNVAQDLTSKADYLIERRQRGYKTPPATTESDPGDISAYQPYNGVSLNDSQPAEATVVPGTDAPPEIDYMDLMDESMNIAFNMDYFNGLDPVAADPGNMFELWTLFPELTR